MSAGKSILGILAGAAVGAAIGILYAPDRGEETRKKISKKGRELSEDMEKKFNNLSGMGTEKLDNIKREVGKRADARTDRDDMVNEMASAGTTGNKGNSNM